MDGLDVAAAIIYYESYIDKSHKSNEPDILVKFVYPAAYNDATTFNILNLCLTKNKTESTSNEAEFILHFGSGDRLNHLV